MNRQQTTAKRICFLLSTGPTHRSNRRPLTVSVYHASVIHVVRQRTPTRHRNRYWDSSNCLAHRIREQLTGYRKSHSDMCTGRTAKIVFLEVTNCKFFTGILRARNAPPYCHRLLTYVNSTIHTTELNNRTKPNKNLTFFDKCCGKQRIKHPKQCKAIMPSLANFHHSKQLL